MSADRRRRTRAEQQAETRARLLDAAAAEFAAHGFDGASIDAITERAGYSRGAFYSNFATKSALLLELSAAQMARFAETALPALLATTEPGRIAEGARYLVEEAPAIEILLLVELVRLRTTNDDVGEVLDQLIDRSVRFVDEVLDAARPTSTHDAPPPHGGAAPDGGAAHDGGATPDGAHAPDPAHAPDAAQAPDGGTAHDVGPAPDDAEAPDAARADATGDTDDRATTTHAVLAAVLGVTLLRHLGVDLDQAVAQRLLGGALAGDTPAEIPPEVRP